MRFSSQTILDSMIHSSNKGMVSSIGETYCIGNYLKPQVNDLPGVAVMSLYNRDTMLAKKPVCHSWLPLFQTLNPHLSNPFHNLPELNVMKFLI